jgi:hypothetical protein
MTNTERQAKLRKARADAGLVQCNVWVPEGCVAEILRAAELMRQNPRLTVARLVDGETGRLRGLK